MLTDDDETPLSDTAQIYGMVVDWQNRPAAFQDLYGMAEAVASKRGGADPQGGLALLTVVAPLAPSENRLATARRPLLEKQLQSDPNNVELVSELGLAYEALERQDECERLLLPHVKRLGTSEGARILGEILARQGKIDEAERLLMPYVKANRQRLVEALSGYGSVIEEIQQSALQQLRDKTAPEEMMRRFQAARDNNDEEAGQRIFDEHVISLCKSSPKLLKAQYRMQQAHRLTNAVLTLAIRRQLRAEQVSDPEQRRPEMKKAEEALDAIEAVAKERSDFLLTKGRNSFWLGKDKVGQKLLDDFLTKEQRSPKSLEQVADLLRDLGNRAKARELAEEGYNKAVDERQKQSLAQMRALSATDVEERITWLKRSDLSDPGVRALLHGAQSTQARLEGDDERAAQETRSAIQCFEKLPPNASVINNNAVAHDQLFQLTGDVSALDKAFDLYDKAVRLQPESSISLTNLARKSIETGVRALTKDKIDYSVLKQGGDLSFLKYLYADAAGRNELVKSLRDNSRIQEAIKRYEHLTVLASKSATPLQTMQQLHSFLRDENALRRLSKTVESAKPDLTDYEDAIRRAFAGVDVEKTSKQTAVVADRLHKRMQALGGREKSLTYAILASQWIAAEMHRASLGATVDADKLVKLAERILQDAPSVGTQHTLVLALLFRAHEALRKREAAYQQLAEKLQRAVSPTELIAAALSSEGALRQIVQAHPDVQRAGELLKERFEAFPHSPGAWSWAILQSTSPDTGEKVAAALAKDEMGKLAQALDERLQPLDASVALAANWYHKSQGREAEGRRILEQFRQRGVPLPSFPVTGEK